MLSIIVAIWCITAFVTCHDKTNVLLFIGDGMGVEEIAFANKVEFWPETDRYLAMESLEHRTSVKTTPLHVMFNHPTDSAASASAISTGQRLLSGGISRSFLFGKDFETLFEFLEPHGYLTGAITTVYLAHATPAAFMSHSMSRGNTEAISQQIVSNPPDVLLGGSTATISEGLAAGSFTTRAELIAAGNAGELPMRGFFSSGNMKFWHERTVPDDEEEEPTLEEMVTAALTALRAAEGERDQPWALVVEAGMIDKGGHHNNAQEAIQQLLGLSDTITAALGLVDLDNTLVLVTADHDTGGFDPDFKDEDIGSYLSGTTAPSTLPDTDQRWAARAERIGLLPCTWTTSSHTNRRVILTGSGVGAEKVMELSGHLQHHQGTAQILRQACDAAWTSPNISYGRYELLLCFVLSGVLVFLAVKLVRAHPHFFSRIFCFCRRHTKMDDGEGDEMMPGKVQLNSEDVTIVEDTEDSDLPMLPAHAVREKVVEPDVSQESESLHDLTDQ